jgi:type VI secretion system protein ImpL
MKPVVWMILVTVIALLLIGALVIALRRRAQKPRALDGEEDLASSVRAIFTAASARLGTRTRDRFQMLLAPATPKSGAFTRRLLVLGAPRSGKTTLLRRVSAGSLVAPTSAEAESAVCNLFNVEGAIAVEAAGRVLLDEGAQGNGGEGFQSLVMEMRKAWPERPVDSIVLTISARELIPGATELDQIRERALKLRKRLDELLLLLEMRAPIYLVITQCDAVPGFTSLGRELASEVRQAVLGWSSLVPPEDDSVVDWVDETFREVGLALTREQTRRFADVGRPPVSDADAYFLFPTELAACAEALRAYVDAIFIPKPTQEPLTLRGIYFSGLGGADEPVLLPDVPPVLFATELFTRKILHEGNLARPHAAAIQRRARWINTIQIASVVLGMSFGGLLALESVSLGRKTASILPFLQHLSSNLVQIQGQPRDSQRAPTRDEALSGKLLDDLGGIEADRLRAVSVPLSGFSRIDSRLESAIAVGFNRVILVEDRRALEAPGLPEPRDVPVDAGDFGAIPIEKTADFASVDRWLRDLHAFEESVAKLDGLVAPSKPSDKVGEDHIQHVADLSDYLFAHKLDKEFFGNARFYTAALAHRMTVLPIDVQALAPPAQQTAKKLFEALQRRLLETYSDHVIRADVAELQKQIDAAKTGSASYAVKDLKALRKAIERLESDLERAGLAWAAGTGPLPSSPKVDELLDAVARSALLGPELRDELKLAERAKMLDLQRTLHHADTALAIPLLAHKDGVLQIKLAPEILALKEPIDGMLRQSYLTGDDDTATALDFEDGRVTWDVDLLKAAAKTLKEYETFVQEGGFKPLPDELGGTLRGLASRRVRDRALATTAKAARREVSLDSGNGLTPIGVIRADAENLAAAGAPMREMIAAFGRIRLDDARDLVTKVVRAQGVRVLKSAQRTLDSESLYRVHESTFSWWDGSGSPAFRAFEVGDAAQLAEYAGEQRGRVDVLSKGIAEPVLGVLESPEVGGDPSAVVVAWEQTTAALHDYDGKKAGNSVASIERFILAELPEITADNCLAELDKASSRSHTDDYFARRRRDIRELLRQRCGSLSSESLGEAYGRLRRGFERSLANRFPFSRDLQTEDASPEATRTFLADVGDFRKRYGPLLARKIDPASKDLVRFLDKSESVRLFLEPLWAQSESGDGAYEVKVGFRANRAREVSGNQIADWSLRLAEERLSLGGAKPSAPWHIGDPVRVQLRWAKNSPAIPAAAQAPGIAVQARLVTIEQRGVWALLRLIAGFQSSLRDPAAKSDASAHMLLLVVNTIPDPTGGFLDRVGTDEGTTRVFVRLSLGGVNKEKSFKFPEFPVSAPALGGGS